ncbi:MAG: hypothetical protein ACR2PM_16295 [Hyphomicrobiales bacterium]
MSNVEPVDETLDQLEVAVGGLTAMSSVSALRHIHNLSKIPGKSLEAAMSAKEISVMCMKAETELLDGLAHIIADNDEMANKHLGVALAHIDEIAATVDAAPPRQVSEERPAPVSIADTADR